jgi:PAS domain S-box-containing protein
MANETLGKVSLSDSAIYQTVLEGMSSGVVVITLDGRIEYLNPAAEALLGLDVAAVRGERLRAYVDPSDEMDRLAELGTRIMIAGRWEGELRLRIRDGHSFTARCRASLLRNGDGEPTSIVVVADELRADNRTEAALIGALEQFRALAECMPSLVRFRWNDGRPAWYNPRFMEFAGLSYRDLERRGWRSLIHPDDRDAIAPEGSLEPWEAEARMLRHDGEYRWMMLRNAPVNDARGEVIGYVGIAADIHERRQAEAEAAAAHRNLEAFWESTPIGLALLDADLRFVRVNERMAEMGGRPAESYLGKSPPEVLPRVEDHFRSFREELMRTRQPILRREREFIVGDERFFRLDSWIPQYDADGALVNVAVVCEDVTPEKRAHKEAEHALAELDAIFEATPVGLALFDRDMRWKKVNPELERMGRIPRTEIVGKAAGTAIPRTRERFEETMEKLAAGEALVRAEREVIIEGEVEYRLDSAARVRDREGNPIGIAVTCEDITPQKRAQKAAEEALRELDGLYQSAPIGLAVMDRDMRFLRVNERIAELTGLPVAAHIGKLPSEVNPGVAGQAQDAVAAVRRGEAVAGVEISLESPLRPGQTTYLRQNWLPLKDTRGEVVGVSITVEDVTEQKAAEAALKASRQHLQQVMEALPEAMFISDEAGNITFANEQWKAMTGLTPPTTVVEGLPLIHEDDRARVGERLRIARAARQPFTATFRTRRRDGSYRWRLSRSVPLFNDEGQVLEWIATSADIDDVKQSQERLATALAELDITYRTAPVGLGVLDLDLRYIRLNEQLAAVSGLPVDELIGRSLTELVPDIADAAREVRDRIVATGEAVLGIETEGMAPGVGEYLYCLENWIPIKDADGNVIAISVSVEDVTSLKRATHELGARHAELDAIFQATSVGLALLDTDLRFVRVNERLAELNGLNPEDLVGRQLDEIINSVEGDAVASARRALAGERIIGDLIERVIDGVRRWRQIGWVPVRDQDGEIVGVGCAIEDVTPLKRAELRLQGALAELSTTYQFAPVGLAVFDPEGRFVRVNERLAAMHGLPVWEHIGRSSEDVLAGDDWAREVVARAVAAGEPVLGAEVATRMPAGSDAVKHLRVSCAPIRNHRDEVFAIAAAVEDISDMKENETLLMNSEQRLRAILDAVPAAIGVTDPAGRLSYLNQPWLSYSGMDLVGMKTDDLAGAFHPDEVEAVARGWRQAVQAEEPYEVLQRLRRADGEYRWHLGRTVPMRDAGGAVTGWVSTNIDIDDRKQAEEQLEAALAEIEATYQGAPIGLAVVDRALRYVRVNEVLASANGMPAWRHASRRLGDLAHCSAKDVERVARTVLETGLPELNVELASQPRRGRSRIWRFSMVPLRDTHREIIGVSIAAEDVTSRKQADDEVRGAKDQLGKILDSIPAPVIVLDEDGVLRLGNRQFWEYTGLRLDPGHAHPMEPLAQSILHPDERDGVLAGYRDAFEREEGFATVCRLRRYDGEYRWHMGAAMALPPGEDGKRAWVGTYMDFEDRKRAEDALQAANRVKDEFLGMVSHELRTPLTTILGLADMLHRRMDHMDRETRVEALDQLEEDAKRLNELIENMLLLSRAEQAVFDPEPVLLQRIAPIVLAVAAERHREARWEMDLPEELPPVSGKAGWLEQVLQNLVTNAVKYSRAPAQVRIEARSDGSEIELRVMDRGKGIRGSDTERMFEPFYRAPHAASGQPGIGLGLSVCRRLVELMDGQISASSRPGGGTILTVRLPLATGRIE